MNVISCDPGSKGAIVFVKDGKCVSSLPTPIVKGTKKLDSQKLLDFLSDCQQKHGHFDAVIELVHAMPTDGKPQIMSFGRITGAVEGIINLFVDEPAIEVVSRVWKKSMGLSGKPKEDAVKLALKKQPDIFDTIYCPTKKTVNKDEKSGIADAYLLGLYYIKVSSHNS